MASQCNPKQIYDFLKPLNQWAKKGTTLFSIVLLIFHSLKYIKNSGLISTLRLHIHEIHN